MPPNRPPPWKQKKRQKDEQQARLPKPTKWYMKHWGIICGFLALLAWVLKDGAAAVESTEDLPKKIESIQNKFLAWHYEDAEWTKWWTTDTEGSFDSEDHVVSNFVAHLNLGVVNGKVTGEFSSAVICKINPMLAPLMFDGEIRFGKVYAVAYQYIGGRRRNFATFSAMRNLTELTIHPIEDPYQLFGEKVDLIAAFTPEQEDFGEDNCNIERQKFISDHISKLRGKPGPEGRIPVNPPEK